MKYLFLIIYQQKCVCVYMYVKLNKSISKFLIFLNSNSSSMHINGLFLIYVQLYFALYVCMYMDFVLNSYSLISR